jgi:hypothetical protein
MNFFAPFIIFNLIFVYSIFLCSAFSETKAGQERAVEIVNEIPYGMKKGCLAARGSLLTALLQVESRTEKDIRIDYEIRVPKPLRPENICRDIQVKELKDAYLLAASFNLSTKFDKWYRTVEIHLPCDMPEGVYKIGSTAQITGPGINCKKFKRDIILEVAAKERLARCLAIKRIIIPVNQMGELNEKEKKNSVLMNRKRTPLISFMLPEKDAFEPAAYAAVEIGNRSRRDASILATLEMLDPETKTPVKGFEPLLPPGHGGLSLKKVYSMARIKAKSNSQVILPIYAEEGVTLAGRYLARFGLRYFGTDTVISLKEVEIDIIARRLTPVFITVSAFTCSFFTLLWMYWKRQNILRIKTKDLITIAMFAGCIFAVVSLPGTIVWQFAHAVLGPFSFLVTGFFSEIVYYILLTALVALIPRVGVAGLAIILRALMTDIIFGGFSPMSILNVGVTVIMSEAAFYICGITRAGTSLNVKRIAFAAVTCGLADVVISFVWFNMHMFLYRLYYDFWYIAIYLLIGGFFYTALAVPFGIRLGLRLKAVY